MNSYMYAFFMFSAGYTPENKTKQNKTNNNCGFVF